MAKDGTTVATPLSAALLMIANPARGASLGRAGVYFDHN